MRDKLLFGTIGLLVGVVVMQWTMPSSNASYVPGDTGIIAARYTSVLDENGMLWQCSPGDANNATVCWFGPYDPHLPVSASEIKFWEDVLLVTKNNEVWVLNFDTQVWESCGPWPGTPNATQQSTWGKIKSQFGAGDKK